MKQSATRLRTAGLCFPLTVLLVAPAVASPAGGNIEEPRPPAVDGPKRKFRKSVIRQSSPATCGPAVLATLLTVFFDDPTGEEEMIALTGTDKKTVSSLKQLAGACAAKEGYAAEGRRWNVPRLLRELDVSDVPVIAHLKRPTEHYVLVVGRVDDYLLLSDPDRGDITVHLTDFLRRWDGFVLVVKSSRPVDKTVKSARLRSAEKRLRTLDRTNTLMSRPRF